MRLARFLPDTDRDALLGDLAESGASRFERFRQVLFLLIRRQFLALLGSLVIAIGFGCNATYFLQGPSASQHHASAGSVLFYLVSSGWVAGRWLRMKSGSALALNLTVVLFASTVSVLIFSAGSDVSYSTVRSLLLNGLFVWGPMGIGLLFGGRRPHATR
jgi:hypothetical protein